jgi:hypothetical protein
MALNFWHADFKFVPLRALQVQPTKRQVLLLANMKKLLKAFGSCQDEVSVPASGRRSASLLSMLSDLSDFLNWEGLAGDSYTQGFPGAKGGLKEVVTVPATTDKAEELVPTGLSVQTDSKSLVLQLGILQNFWMMLCGWRFRSRLV